MVKTRKQKAGCGEFSRAVDEGDVALAIPRRWSPHYSVLESKHKFGLVFLASSILCGFTVAADVAWPSDFWTVFSNRVTTARAAATATTEPTSITMTPAWIVETEDGIGTVSEPFDSVDRSSIAVNVALFNSTIPKGSVVVFR